MAGRKVFAPATVLTAADVNNFLMDQAVMVFADSTARGSAIPTPTEGMVTYLEDTNALEVFTGASFVPIAEDSPITTQGDLIIGDASGDPVRLAVGAADTVLTSDGTTLSFAAPAGGGITLISTTTLSGATTTISSLPQTFNQLIFRIKNPRFSADNGEVFLRANGVADEYNNISYGQAALSTAPFTGTSVRFIDSPGPADDATDGGNVEAFIEIQIPFYTSNVAKYFQFISLCTSATTGFNIQHRAGFSLNTNAITEISLFPLSGTFTGGTIELFGVN